MRFTLKRAFADGTFAVDLDPLSLLCRLAACVPPPRLHTVKYGGVLASASPWRARIAPTPKGAEGHEHDTTGEPVAAARRRGGGCQPSGS